MKSKQIPDWQRGWEQVLSLWDEVCPDASENDPVFRKLSNLKYLDAQNARFLDADFYLRNGPRIWTEKFQSKMAAGVPVVPAPPSLPVEEEVLSAVPPPPPAEEDDIPMLD